MGRKRKTEFWQSATMNNATYIQYYNRLIELSISMFEWKNVPNTIDTRFLELSLFTLGHAVFFEDNVLGYLALRASLGGDYNVYNIPNTRNVYASNGYNKRVTSYDSVIIYNNNLRTNSMLDCENFAKRLYNLDRIIDVNANAQKTPILIKCAENERNSFLNLYKEYDGNAPVIKGDRGLNNEEFGVLQTNAPYVADKIYTLKTQIWNEALTYLGISNINIQKKERMITDEVTRNQGGTIASRYSRLNARQDACKKINDMFGLNIWCEYKEDFQILDEKIEGNENEFNELLKVGDNE